MIKLPVDLPNNESEIGFVSIWLQGDLSFGYFWVSQLEKFSDFTQITFTFQIKTKKNFV